jgi:signal transduction histidine kinase/CheY-like chemotaxis protein
MARAIAAELEGSRDAERTVRCERGAGEAFVELRLERTGAGDPPLVLATISDAGGRVRSERARARVRDAMEAVGRRRAVGELASGIAHDLNNTLHALRLRLSRIAICEAGCAEHGEDLRAVERIAAGAGARVRRLQDLARRREERPDERVALEPLVAVAVEAAHLDGSDPATAVSLSVDLPPLPAVVANGTELAHVFVDLFLNATEAMPGGGRIAVSGATTADGHVEIAVADEGRGIPPEHLARVFDPFFTTKGRYGTGLGLSMAAGVMRRLGGSIRAANGPRGGATFTLRFPLPPPPAAPRAPPPPAPPAAIARGRVLVVDDDPDNLDAMRLVLEQHGRSVEVTASGLDAVARVEAGERYETVLCDLGLDGVTGWDVAARIAAAAPETRILLVTGWAEEIPPDDPRRRNVARVLAKPLGVEELREILGEPPPAPPAGAGRSPDPRGRPDEASPAL